MLPTSRTVMALVRNEPRAEAVADDEAVAEDVAVAVGETEVDGGGGGGAGMRICMYCVG